MLGFMQGSADSTERRRPVRARDSRVWGSRWSRDLLTGPIGETPVPRRCGVAFAGPDVEPGVTDRNGDAEEHIYS